MFLLGGVGQVEETGLQDACSACPSPPVERASDSLGRSSLFAARKSRGHQNAQTIKSINNIEDLLIFISHVLNRKINS